MAEVEASLTARKARLFGRRAADLAAKHAAAAEQLETAAAEVAAGVASVPERAACAIKAFCKS